MANSEIPLEKVPRECLATIQGYAYLIYRAGRWGNRQIRDEYTKRLHGYLICLKDLGLIDEADMRNLYRWACTSQWVSL